MKLIGVLHTVVNLSYKIKIKVLFNSFLGLTCITPRALFHSVIVKIIILKL